MYLRGLATATPERTFSQKDCLALLQSHPSTLARLDRRSRLMLSTILRGDSGVDKRRFAVTAEKLFQLDADGLNAEFRRTAPKLGAQALARALEQSSLAPKNLDALIVTTCTGYLCPGLSSYIAEIIGLKPNAWLQDIVGLGCGAAIPAWRAASSILAAEPDATIACLSVEICSAAFYLDNDPGVIVSACLFGDGAAATIWGSKAGAAQLRCHSFDTLHQPEHRDLIRFEQREGKLRNLLHSSVPELASRAVALLYENARRASPRPVSRVLSHAGGRDVIAAIRKEMPEFSLEETTAILKRHGNMSSPSVVFALQQAMRSGRPEKDRDWWLVSFGAGFSAHSCRVSLV
ncbi:MAG: type III polyketide synthase [Chthoniobacterales bacterium]